MKWDKACEKGYDELTNSKGKTPGRTIDANLREYGVEENEKEFYMPSKGKFYVRDSEDIKDTINDLNNTSSSKNVVTSVKNKTSKCNFKEKDLHPLLTYYMYKQEGVYTKTIDEKHSHKHKKGVNEWLHPDMVGIKIPVKTFENGVISFSDKISNFPMTLYSFELKRSIDFSNIRKCYFQAVSNSSWANEGYLVAAQIPDDEEFREELKGLTVSFGIGIIQLNRDEPNKSKVLYPATSKENLDLTTINKLYKENTDFQDYIKSLSATLETSSKNIYTTDFDKIKKIDDLIRLPSTFHQFNHYSLLLLNIIINTYSFIFNYLLIQTTFSIIIQGSTSLMY